MSLEVRNLSFAYPGHPDLLTDCSFSLQPDKITVLLGRNGCGKSTLGKLLSGLHSPTAGQILLDGTPLEQLAFRQRAARIGVMAQLMPPVFDFTAEEIILAGLHPRLSRFSPVSDRDRENIRKHMDELEIRPLAERIFSTLSGGEQQRIRLAAVLALESPWLILDEPTSAQDPAGTRLIIRQLQALPWHPGILLITHDLMLAAACADRMILLHDRTVLAEGPAAEVFTRKNLETLYGCAMQDCGQTDRKLPLYLPAAT